MEIVELKIRDAYLVTPQQHQDDRGVFLEYFKEKPFTAAVGHPLVLRQANTSVSRCGTVRGIHFADVPPGQSKYVTCPSGAVFDVVVDIRVGSPTFGQWDAVRLDDTQRQAVYVGEGLGHVFMALTEGAVISYLCSEGYNPGGEHGVHPMDPEIGIVWPAEVAPLLSPKDEAAPTLAEAKMSGLLPSYDECRAFYASLGQG